MGVSWGPMAHIAYRQALLPDTMGCHGQSTCDLKGCASPCFVVQPGALQGTCCISGLGCGAGCGMKRGLLHGGHAFTACWVFVPA